MLSERLKTEFLTELKKDPISNKIKMIFKYGSNDNVLADLDFLVLVENDTLKDDVRLCFSRFFKRRKIDINILSTDILDAKPLLSHGTYFHACYIINNFRGEVIYGKHYDFQNLTEKQLRDYATFRLVKDIRVSIENNILRKDFYKSKELKRLFSFLISANRYELKHFTFLDKQQMIELYLKSEKPIVPIRTFNFLYSKLKCIPVSENSPIYPIYLKELDIFKQSIREYLKKYQENLPELIIELLKKDIAQKISEKELNLITVCNHGEIQLDQFYDYHFYIYKSLKLFDFNENIICDIINHCFYKKAFFK